MKHKEFIDKILWMFDETNVDSIQETLELFNIQSIILDSDQIQVIDK